MLYRPCLIKLIDPDDPTNWEYHLREQKLPFFITLAHEFLHALNQLERIEWILETLGIRTMEELFKELNLNKFDANNFNFRVLCLFNKRKINKHNLLDFHKQLKLKYDNYLNRNFPFVEVLETIFPIQNFLRRKLRLQNDTEILLQKYNDLWGNDNCDDSLDEMTVILQNKRKVSFREIVYIGETSFLQEYYNNPFIISWSHYSAHSIKFLEKMTILLEKNYINNMICCNKFKIHQQTIQNFLKKKNLDQIFCEKFFKYTNISNMDDFRKSVEDTIKHLMGQPVVRTVIVNGIRKEKIEKVEKFEILQSDEGIVLLPKYSKYIVLNNYKSVDLSKEENNSLMQNLTNISLNESFFRYFQAINSQRKILVIMDDERLSYKYWLSDNGPHKIFSEARNIEKILEQNSNADVKLYYNGVCFQKIVDRY